MLSEPVLHLVVHGAIRGGRVVAQATHSSAAPAAARRCAWTPRHPLQLLGLLQRKVTSFAEDIFCGSRELMRQIRLNDYKRFSLRIRIYDDLCINLFASPKVCAQANCSRQINKNYDQRFL